MKSFLVSALIGIVHADLSQEVSRLLLDSPEIPLSDMVALGFSVGSDMKASYAQAFESDG